MTPEEFRYWRAYNDFEPIGDRKICDTLAIQTWLISSIFGGSKSGVGIEDFLPRYGKTLRDIATDKAKQVSNTIRAWGSQVNAFFKRGETKK